MISHPGDGASMRLAAVRVLTPAQAQRLTGFRDSRGQHVTVWPGRAAIGTNALICRSAAALSRGPPWEILLQRRQDNGYWAMPGGAMEAGESLEATVCREVCEETGLTVQVHGIVAVDSDPRRYAISLYPDGAVHYCCITVLASWVTGTLRLSEESVDLGWYSTDALPVAVLLAHRERLALAEHAYRTPLPLR